MNVLIVLQLMHLERRNCAYEFCKQLFPHEKWKVCHCLQDRQHCQVLVSAQLVCLCCTAYVAVCVWVFCPLGEPVSGVLGFEVHWNVIFRENPSKFLRDSCHIMFVSVLLSFSNSVVWSICLCWFYKGLVWVFTGLKSFLLFSSALQSQNFDIFYVSVQIFISETYTILKNNAANRSNVTDMIAFVIS